jgi:hypothetical protein
VETYLLAPILNILVQHTGQVPSVAGRPFFMVIGFASVISREVLHFMQYAEAGAVVFGVAVALAIWRVPPGLVFVQP